MFEVILNINNVILVTQKDGVVTVRFQDGTQKDYGSKEGPATLKLAGNPE